MSFPSDYVFGLDESQIKKHFPKLNKSADIKFTSLRSDEYNCVAWANNIDDEWIQFVYDEYGNYDIHVNRYISYFVSLGYKITDSEEYKVGVEKIAIYADSKDEFKHVARQLSNGKWTSKLGDWEDIEHNNLDVLTGSSYGSVKIIMEKR